MHQTVIEKLKAAKPLEKQRFIEKPKAAEYEAATLRMPNANKCQKLRLMPRFWRSSIRKVKRKYRRIFFKLTITTTERL